MSQKKEMAKEMAFAYFDKYGVFHIVDGKDEAVQYARDGKVAEVDVPHEYGYPTVVGADGKVKQVTIYDRGNGVFQAYIDGNQKDGTLLDPEAYAHLKGVLEQLV